MSELDHQLALKEPISFFNKPLRADWKALFKALSKAAGNAVLGKWTEVGAQTVESLCALGVHTQPHELAYLLIHRSLVRAVFEVLGENVHQQLQPRDADAVIAELQFSEALLDFRIGREFLERPAELPLLEHLQPLLCAWLERHDVPAHAAQAVAGRLPSYFVYALNEEWQQHRSTYLPLLEALDTPFSKAGESEWQWRQYSALLNRRIHEALFDEPFSLAQIYVPLNAYCEDTHDRAAGSHGRARTRVVVSLCDELNQWLAEPQPESAIRVISGGPGSGKSSLLRIFAAASSSGGKFKVLFIPLHLIDTSRELVDEVNRFVRDEGILSNNPLAAEFREKNLLVVFDGLDELAAQGKAAAETARAFIREVERTVERRNVQSVRLRVLISGRELTVQENEAEFRKPRQVLTLLPYFGARSQLGHTEQYEDPQSLLDQDLRDIWWTNYGLLTGRDYRGLPAHLAREDLAEITAQPLLNYLLALSVVRGRLNFDQEINLNSIYADLVIAVHERGYEKYGSHRSIRHMRREEFERVLEEIGLAAWHGDGRTTTVREIEKYCRSNGLGKQLDAFREGAEAGVTRLLAAFFFRQYGQRASGDPTFIFTHKSFGEYLAARRVVRAIGRMIRELDAHESDPDGGWDERSALKHWAMICGPSPLTHYLRDFIRDEIKLRAGESVDIWQERLTELFGFMVRHGLPAEQLGLGTFQQMQFQAGNAAESLLVVLNACAQLTQREIQIHPELTLQFGDWYVRLGRHLNRWDSGLAHQCLSRLNLSGFILSGIDFEGASLEFANLMEADVDGCNLIDAYMVGVNLKGTHLLRSCFECANLADAQCYDALMDASNFRLAILVNANLSTASLVGANLSEARLQGASLKGADLTGAILIDAILDDACFEGAILKGTIFSASARDRLELQGVDVSEAYFVDNETEPT